MKPVKQSITHAPHAGTWGDCHRAAVATVLNLPLAAVPHFSDGGPGVEEFKARERAFLGRHGLVPINAVYAGSEVYDGPGLILEVVSALNPGSPYLLGGRSRHGNDHTVVCQDGAVVHDPSHDAAGIVAPSSDGWYWVTFFGAADLDRRPRCNLCGYPMAPNSLTNGVTVCARDGRANSD